MTIYIVLFVIIIGMRMLKVNKKYMLLISFLILFLISALRKYTVGVDSIQYYQKYIEIGSYSGWNYTHFRYEPGFFYLCKILNYISDDPQLLFVITSAFINFSVYYFIKKNSDDYFLSIIVFVIFNTYFSTMNTMREWLAISFILFGFQSLIKKKYIGFLISLALAISFHNAAWAGFLLIFTAFFRRKKWLYIVLILTSVVIFFTYQAFYSYLSSIFGYQDYNEKFTVSNYYGALLIFIESASILLILYLYLFFNHKLDEIINDDKSSLLLSCSILYLAFLASVMRVNLFNRISGFYEVFIILTIPDLIKRIRNEKDKVAFQFICISVMTISFIIICINRSEWLGCIPYEFFWN